MNKWHTLTATRSGSRGQLALDDGEPKNGITDFTQLNVVEPLNVGSIKDPSES